MDFGERHDAKKAARAANQSQNGVRGADWKEWFVVGVAVDVYRGGSSTEEEYFILADCMLDDLEFVNSNGILFNRDEFRKRYGGEGTRIGTSAGRRVLFERNKANYQKALLARMGQLHERFFTIFTKAPSFTTIFSTGKNYSWI